MAYIHFMQLYQSFDTDLILHNLASKNHRPWNCTKVNLREILEIDIALFTLKTLYLQQEYSSMVQI